MKNNRLSTTFKFLAITIFTLSYSSILWANSPLHFIKSIGQAGTENGQFDFNGGHDRSGGVFFNGTYLYVTDWNNNRLQRFNSDGTFKDWLGNVGGKWDYYTSGLSSTNCYSALFADTSGNVYIQYDQSIQKHNSIGELVATFPGIGWSFRRFTIDANGNFFATGSNNNSISKYSPSGNLLATFGSFGVGNGQFNNGGWTVDIVCDSAGNVYMLDQGGKRLQKFSNTGAFLAKWPVDISGYSLMAIDENDMLYVMEDGDSILRKYNTNGVLQKSYFADGVAQGGSSYIFVRSGKLYVSNGLNEFQHTVRIYSLSQTPTPNPSLQSMYGSVTISATVSYPQARPTNTKISRNIKTETESSKMATYTISNAMVLQLAVQANLIPSTAGYSIICPDDWESGLEFFAYKKGSPLVSLSPIISFTESVNVQSATKITTTNLATSAETVSESGTEKSYGTGMFNDMSIAVNRTITFKSGTVKLNGTNYSYYPSTTTGTFFGGSESGTMFVEGKFSVATSKPIDVPAQ